MKATIHRGFDLSEVEYGVEQVCLETARHPDASEGELACWRQANHGGMHWDAADGVAWTAFSFAQEAKRSA